MDKNMKKLKVKNYIIYIIRIANDSFSNWIFIKQKILKECLLRIRKVSWQNVIFGLSDYTGDNVDDKSDSNEHTWRKMI